MFNFKKIIFAIIVGYLLIYILPLGMRALHTPDETRYGEIPREMIDSGNWVAPRLCGLRYFEKPAMGYWLNALSIKTFGENAFAVRLPTALSAGLSALILFFLLLYFGGGLKVAAVGSISFLTCGLVFALGIYAVLDGMLALMLTSAMASFFVAYSAEERNRKLLFLVLFGVFCAFAFLIKGFLAFVIPVVVIGPFLLLQKRWKDIFVLPWLPLIIVLVVVLPWAVSIHLQESDFWRYFFWEEHVARFAAEDAQHRAPFWYYIPVLIGGTLPWVFLFPAAISGLIKKRDDNLLVKYALCWFIFPFLFFSISKGKLGTYILPVFVPLMILFAIGIWKYFEGTGRKLFKVGAALSVLLALVLFVAFSFFPLNKIEDVIFPEYMFIFRIFAGIALLLWAFFMIKAMRAATAERSVLYACLSPVLFFVSLAVVMSQVHVSNHNPGKFLESHSSEIGADTIVVSDNYMGPAVCWYLKRNDIYILESKGELDYGLDYDDAKDRFLTFRSFRRMVDDKKRSVPVVLIIGENRLGKFGNNLPAPKTKYIKNRYVFIKY